MLDYCDYPCCSGSPLRQWYLSNDQLRLQLFDLGAAILSLDFKRSGQWLPLLRGEPDPGWRLEHRPYYNAVIGPYANRLGGASCTVSGSPCHFPANEGLNFLHSGPWGWQKKIWTSRAEGDALVFHFTSLEGDSPFPGTLQVECRYELLANTLRISFQASSSKDTLFAPIHHPYFNLDPQASSVAGHQLQLSADAVTDNGPGKIPTGTFSDVSGSLFDFRSPVLLGPRLDALRAAFPALAGLDHNFDTRRRPTACPQAELFSEDSGIRLTLDSNFPGLQVYSCQDGGSSRKGDGSLPPYFALSLEAQEFPDAPHHPDFPSVILPAGEVRERWITYTLTDQNSDKKEDVSV